MVIEASGGVHSTGSSANTPPPNGEVRVVEARANTGDTWYKMKMFMRQPWFIGTMGAVAWIILLIVVVLLYRQRRSKRKAKTPTRGEVVFIHFCSLSHAGRSRRWVPEVFLACTTCANLVSHWPSANVYSTKQGCVLVVLRGLGYYICSFVFSQLGKHIFCIKFKASVLSFASA